jgi:tetratricopeptide (TPR) repeat protein
MSSEESWIREGSEAEELGQYERALEIYVESVAKASSAYGYAAAYDIAWAIWKYSQAFEIIGDAVSRFPHDPLLRFRYGHALVHRSAFDLSIKEYEAALKNGLPTDEGKASIVSAYIASGEMDNAREVIATISPDSAHGKRAYADLLSATGDKSASANILLELASAERTPPELITSISATLEALGHREAALKHLLLALGRRPENPDLQFRVAATLLNKGDLEAAGRQITPVTRSAWLLRGSIAYARGDYVAAHTFLKDALGAENTYPLQVFSYCAVKLGKFEDAIHGYSKLLWLKPGSGRAKGAIMHAARRAGDWKTFWIALFAPRKLWIRYGFGYQQRPF